MPVLPSFLIGLALGLVLAGVAGYYVWRVWRPRREVFEGRRILAAMRWRELSNLVMDALASSGFEPEPADTRSARGANADVVMHRDGRPWIVVCKQGLDHRVLPPAVEEVHRTVRMRQAGGAVIVTPGHIDPKARDVAPEVELVDGTQLWRLLEPLLPESVHEEVAMRARSRATRHSAVVAAVATVVTFGATWALTQFSVGDAQVAPVVTGAAPAAPAAASAEPPVDRPPPVSTLSEEAQRLELPHRLNDVPGVDRAVWSTASTLQVFIEDPAIATDAAICQVMTHYPLLRASRLQLQPPPGSDRPVRFKQCSVF